MKCTFSSNVDVTEICQFYFAEFKGKHMFFVLPITRDVLSKHVSSCAIFLVFLLGYSSAFAELEIAVVTEKEWSRIFLEITDGSNANYLMAVINYSTKELDSANANLRKSMEAGNMEGVRSGLREGLIGHLLSWYAFELHPLKGTAPWFEKRNSMLELRRSYVRIGLDSNALEGSFHNMNKAARTLALPTVDSLY